AIPTELRPGWRLAGWAWDKKAARTPRYVLLADRVGTVAGVALTEFIAPPELAVLSPRYQTSTWQGYVNGEPREITAYALETDGRTLCPIGSKRLPEGMEVTFNRLGPALPEITPNVSPGWVRDGYFKGDGGPGAPPSGGPVFGSYPDS